MRWVEYKNTSFQPFQKDRAERHLCQRRKLHILSTISTISVVQEVASRELTLCLPELMNMTVSIKGRSIYKVSFLN